MKAEHRKELETNSLAEGMTALVDRAKSGRLINYRILGIVLAVVIVGGVWWYAARQSRTSLSKQWTAFELATTTADITTLADNSKQDTAGKAARLEIARRELGPEGIGMLRARELNNTKKEIENQKKGIENIEKARAELLKLADEFKSDLTMQTSILVDAAEAELALVGIPKEGGSGEFRGSVKAAADLYRKAADRLGDKSPLAEKLRKKADDLDKNELAVRNVGNALYTILAEKKDFDFTPHPAVGPKPPADLLGPIPTPKPPEGAKPDGGVKAPDKPLATPPPPPAPPVVKPAPPTAPPTTAPTKK